jgi:putative flippase GtrA
MMRDLYERYWVRYRYSWMQLIRFSVVGLSGFVVNLVVFATCLSVFGNEDGVVFPLIIGDFNVRNYHVYAMVAFFVANISNYLLNRAWTFKSAGTASMWREYVPFLTIGLAAQFFGLLILTVGVRVFELDKIVAQAVAILLITPLSYLGNKLWSFSNVRGKL